MVSGLQQLLIVFIRFLLFDLVCWFRLISSYSIELGFRGSGFVTVSLLWCYAQEV